MPKRRVRNLDGIRIEFNQTERDALEMWAAGSAAGDVLSGVGRILAPFEGAITALTVAWIAEEGIKSILGGAQKAQRVYNDAKSKVDEGLAQRMAAEPGLSEQDAFARMMDRELTWYEKISLRVAGYDW